MFTISHHFRWPGIHCTTWNKSKCVPFGIIFVAVELNILPGINSNVYHFMSFSLPWNWFYYLESIQMCNIWHHLHSRGIDSTSCNEFECGPFDIVSVALELIVLPGMNSNVYHLTSFSLPWNWLYYVEWIQMWTISHDFRCPGIHCTTWNQSKCLRITFGAGGVNFLSTPGSCVRRIERKFVRNAPNRQRRGQKCAYFWRNPYSFLTPKGVQEWSTWPLFAVEKWISSRTWRLVLLGSRGNWSLELFNESRFNTGSGFGWVLPAIMIVEWFGWFRNLQYWSVSDGFSWFFYLH